MDRTLPSINVPAKEQAIPTAKPANTTFRALLGPVGSIGQVGHQECDRVGESAPCQPIAKQELNEDVRGNDDHCHCGDANHDPESHGCALSVVAPCHQSPRISVDPVVYKSLRLSHLFPQTASRTRGRFGVFGFIPLGFKPFAALANAKGVERSAAELLLPRKDTFGSVREMQAASGFLSRAVSPAGEPDERNDGRPEGLIPCATRCANPNCDSDGLGSVSRILTSAIPRVGRR